MRLLKILFLLVICTSVTATPADTLTQHQAIEQGAKKFLHSFFVSNESLTIQIEKLDSRVPITSCPQGFNYNLPGATKPSHFSTVKVTCPDNGWYLFINARIKQTVTAVVTTRSLQKGATINAGDVAIVEIESSQLRGEYFSETTPLIGAKIKRFTSANKRVAAKDICIVCKGDRVSLTAKKGALRVATTAISLSDGLVGDIVKVKNIRSERIVSVQVKSIGATELSL